MLLSVSMWLLGLSSLWPLCTLLHYIVQCEDDTIWAGHFDKDAGTVMCCLEGHWWDMRTLQCKRYPKPDDLDCLPDSAVPDDLCPRNKTIYGEFYVCHKARTRSTLRSIITI